ncbi:diguanylate cyclase [Rhodoplanes sp. Z2-YC6860]|nr:diguanylate cyclase [Rhodoplanes sp. Z2-YC6860]
MFATADVFATPAVRAPEPRGVVARELAFDPARIMASIGEAPYEWTIESDVLAWGANATDVLNVGSLAAISSGRNYAKLLASDTAASRFDAVMKSQQRDGGSGVPYQLQYVLQPAGSDKSLWIEDIGRWFAGADGKPARAHGVVRVINERHAQEERLTYLSRFDGLTGEMNRFHLTEVLESTLNQAVAQRNSCGFMLVAVDNLARINESYGFDVADEAIGAVAKRLRAKMRGGDELGRFSGNKFGVILNNCTAEDMEKAAERLIAGVRDDVIRTGAGPVAVTVTIGGVTAPRHAANVPEILARAQETLDRAKAKRLGSFQVYRPNVEREILRRENVRAADEIVNALNERRILLAFEPIAETVSRQTAYYECLMRIRRADGSLAPASSVIPIAERLGLVRLIDHRVLELLVSEMAAVPALRASVNVSPASITDPDWWSTLGALLRANSGVAERLIVEITESTAIHDVDDTRGFVSRVKDLGCKIAVDDFGSGYTSFRNLRKLGVDVLKIDGAFVQNLMRADDDRSFVRSLVDLARRLGLSTVAEWVQDEPSAALLAEWGCDYLQGQLIGLASLERPWGDTVKVDRRKAPREHQDRSR